jgi:hypothetical protein
MSAESSRSIFVRLPAELREWVVHEALVGRRSMSAVVVQAVDFMKSTRTYQLECDQHVAAIERAISVAHLLKGTAITLRTEHDRLRTHILVQLPSEADCSVLACVDGKGVVFAENFVTPVVDWGA